MILFKYYSESSGLSALQSGCLGFRNPCYFNDPLELSYYSGVDLGVGVAAEGQIKEIQKSVAVLSMTTSDVNPLMWAHYGGDHKGFCIGYDVSCKFFSDEYCLIPASKGKVAYTNEKPISGGVGFKPGLYEAFLKAMGDDEPGSDFSKNIAKKLYLTKSKDWEYENEFSVVKLTDSFFDESHAFQNDPLRSFKTLTVPFCDDNPSFVREVVSGLRLFSYNPKIVSVTLGLRNSWSSRKEVIEYALKNNWECVLDDSLIKKVESSKTDWKFVTTDLI